MGIETKPNQFREIRCPECERFLCRAKGAVELELRCRICKQLILVKGFEVLSELNALRAMVAR